MPELFLAWANIRKKKGVAVTMGILILLSVAMFNVGLTILAGIGNFYIQENERLNGPHYMVRISGNSYREEYLDFFKHDSRVETAEADETIFMNMLTLPGGGALSANFRNLDQERKIKGYSLVNEPVATGDNAIYIPSFFKEMGYDPGEELVLNYNKQTFRFQIAGYTQSTWFNSSVSSIVDFYLPQAAYDKLYTKLGTGYLLTVRLMDSSQIETVRQDFIDHTDVKMEAITMDNEVMDISIDTMKAGATMVVSIISAILFAFSFLMVVITIIVMRFRIANHIELQMKNIGTLEAIGYTGKQIQWSIVLEFIIISLIGTILGIVCSYGMIALLGGIITNSVGVSWRSGGHLGYDLLSGLVIMGIVVLATRISASKASRLLPIQALRGGTEAHSFQRIYVPLERWGNRLSMALGLKILMFHKKIYVMVTVIFAGVAFASAFSMILYQNLGMDDNLVLKLTGYEISDIMVYTAPHADYDKLKKEIDDMDGVRKTNLYETSSAKVEEELVTCYISDQFHDLEMVSVYEGTFPQYDNEIVVTGVLAEEWGKHIGDTLEVQSEGAAAEYVICGLTQTMNNFGRQCFLSMEGFLRINPAYERSSIQVYLEPGIEIEEYINTMERTFSVLSPGSTEEIGMDDTRQDNQQEAALLAAKKKAEEKLTALLSMYDVSSAQYALMVDGEMVLSGDTSQYQISRIENNRKMFVTNVDTISLSVGLVSAIILVGTLLMITLIFYMVIKSMLSRQHHTFGILKAIGFTDRQLMEQISMSFLPSSIGGTAAGSLLACLSVNQLSSILFAQIGISQFSFIINPWLIAFMGTVLVLFSFAISQLMARKIKDITVYGLLTEE